MTVSRFSRRSLLATAAAAPLAPAVIRAQSLQHVDLLIDWKPAPTYAGFYIARETGASSGAASTCASSRAMAPPSRPR